MTDLHDTDDDFGARTVRRPLNASDRFESKAAKFYADTLVMAPGKDSATNDHTYEERLLAWDVWCGQQARIAELEAVNARLSAQVLRTQDKALELEQQLAELLEAVDMTILKHRIRKEKAGLVWFYMPSEEMEKLAALLQESSDE